MTSLWSPLSRRPVSTPTVSHPVKPSRVTPDPDTSPSQPEFGTVLRIQSSLTVSPDLPGPNTVGEWRSMGMSNYLLSTYPPLHRAYTSV